MTAVVHSVGNYHFGTKVCSHVASRLCKQSAIYQKSTPGLVQDSNNKAIPSPEERAARLQQE